MAELQEGKKNDERSGLKGWLLFLPVVFFLIVLLSVVSILVFPFLQEAVTKSIVNRFNKEIKGEFEFKDLYAKGKTIYIKDLVWYGKCADTIVYVNEASFDVKIGLFSLTKNEVRLDRFRMKNAFLHQNTFLGDSIPTVVEAFAKKITPTSRIGKRLTIRIQNGEIENFCYQVSDQNNSSEFDICTELLFVDEVEFRHLDNNLKFINAVSQGANIAVEFNRFSEGAYKYPPPSEEWTYLTLEFENSLFCDAQLDWDNYRSETTFVVDESIDYNHISFSDLNIDVGYFYKYLLDFSIVGLQMSAIEKSGLVLNNFSLDLAKINCTNTELENLNILTQNTSINTSLEFDYPDGYSSWLRFDDEVKMKGDFADSYLSPKDVFLFAPQMRENKFLYQNRTELFSFTNSIVGTLNKLRIRDLDFSYANQSFLYGQMTLRDITSDNGAFISLRIDELKSRVSSLRQAFPDVTVPSSFDKLGQITFSGTFDGSADNFVTYGDFETYLGRAKLDLSMSDMQKNNVPPKFSGSLSLNNFNIAEWVENEQLGLITVTATVKEGRGLSFKNAEATLEAEVARLDYNDYSYQNISYNGVFSKSTLDGTAVVRDPNLEANYKGQINIVDSNYVVDAKIDVNKFRLQELNFSEYNYQLTANADLSFSTNKLLDFIGYAKLDSLQFTVDTSLYELDNFSIYSLEYGEGQHLNIIGEGFDARIDGDYKLKNFYKPLVNTLYQYNPDLCNYFNINPYPNIVDSNNFLIRCQIDSLVGWTKLLSPNLERLDDLNLIVNHRSDQAYADFNLTTPVLSISGVDIFNPIVDTRLDYGKGRFRFKSDSMALGKTVLPPMSTIFDIDRNFFDFAYAAHDIDNFLDHANFNGSMELSDIDGLKIELNYGFISLFNELWSVKEDNRFIINDKKLYTRNCKLENGQKKIEIKSNPDDRIEVGIRSLDLSMFNSFIPIQSLKLGGKYDAVITMDNSVKIENFDLEASSEEFLINKDDFGRMKVKASLTDLNSEISGNVMIEKASQKLTSEFKHNLTENKQYKAHYTQVWNKIDDFPANFLEYFTGESLKDTEGQFDADFKIYGYPEKLGIQGALNIDSLSTTMDYLKMRYSMINQSIQLNNEIFDCTDCLLLDDKGNVAIIKGGIRHKALSDLSYDVKLRSDNFHVLNTTKQDNQYYYGQAYMGNAEVEITGPLIKPKLLVEAKSNPNTELQFPLTSVLVSEERNFIQFNRRDSVESNQVANSAGIDMKLNLDVTEDALMSIIFDEKSGDVIRSTGAGNISVEYDETEALKVYGVYDIKEGDYLFTYLNFVNKPFKLREGSNIQFTGDPYEALLNVTADYSGLSTPIYPLIQEYLNDVGNTTSLARSPTSIDLSMILTGDLFSPEINFDIGFPDLDRQLRNFAEAKINSLDNIQNDLNRQVFGLLVVGSFLPSQQGQLQGTQLLTGLNTVSQMISNQLSGYITGLVGDLLKDDNTIISGFEFDLNYSFYNNGIANANLPTTSSELIVSPRFYLFNNRVTLDVSGNYNNASGYSNNNLTSNFELGIELTEDGRWRFRAYQKFEPLFEDRNRSKTGVGLSYRTNFNNFKELVSRMNKKIDENNQ